MITFLLLIADIIILAIAYIGPRLALCNLAKKYNTTTEILLDNCANLKCSYDFINETFIASIVFKIFTILAMLLVYHDICYDTNNMLGTFIFFDLLLFLGEYSIEADGFYVKANDLKKICRKSIKI